MRLVIGCLLVLAIPFLLGGICVTAVTAVQWNEFQALSQSGATTKATVVNRYYDNDLYHVSYQFMVNDEKFDNTDTVDRGVYDTVEKGSQITIQYARSDPTISHIGTRESKELALALTVCSVCWDAFALVWIGLALRTLLRSRRSG